MSESAASRHVAFIRNVMVGRANLHRDVLLRIFAAAGAVEPRSRLATGNVSFGWDGADVDGLIASAQDGIAATMGRLEPIFVRSTA